MYSQWNRIYEGISKVANLQIGVKPQNEKNQHNSCDMKMGIAKQAGRRGIIANRLKAIVVFS